MVPEVARSVLIERWHDGDVTVWRVGSIRGIRHCHDFLSGGNYGASRTDILFVDGTEHSILSDELGHDVLKQFGYKCSVE